MTAIGSKSEELTLSLLIFQSSYLELCVPRLEYKQTDKWKGILLLEKRADVLLILTVHFFLLCGKFNKYSALGTWKRKKTVEGRAVRKDRKVSLQGHSEDHTEREKQTMNTQRCLELRCMTRESETTLFFISESLCVLSNFTLNKLKDHQHL